ncbi:EthD domain-containing protein [Amycolatopsis circi]|uniref:EthD domain-containing protein n=1 Tax=Amycolatopsis circi TaxID=871959 RepID=UPI000E24ED43|nr:EthD domain-containing protein [Amycolatopsis circi]
MLKIIATFKFRPDLSREEAQAYWNDTHNDVVRRCLPECRKYVQNVSVPVRSRSWPYDGISELWFDDMESIKRSFSGPLNDELVADEEKFAVDKNWVIVTENPVF